MIIGVDTSRAFIKDKTGTENYSYELIKAMLKLPESKKHKWRLYVRDEVQPSRMIPEGALKVFEGEVLEEGSLYDYLQGSSLKVIKWRRLWTQGGLALECLKNPPDVLFIPAHTLPIIRRPSLKTVVTIHGLEYEYLPEYYDWRKRWYLNKSTEYAVKKADKLIAVSKWTKNQLVDRLGADEKKIEVIYEGVGERFKKVRPCGSARSNLFELPDKYILFVGTIQPRKNLVRLIEAFAKIRRFGTVELVIVGKKGWMTDEIYQAPKKYGVENRIKFIGRVSDKDLPYIYSKASLFIMPSLMEGFGLPILEAMSMGVPVICSNRGALPEIGGKACLQINPESVKDLKGAIELVLHSQELREGLIEKGYGRAKNFSWVKTAKKTLKLLTE